MFDECLKACPALVCRLCLFSLFYNGSNGLCTSELPDTFFVVTNTLFQGLFHCLEIKISRFSMVESTLHMVSSAGYISLD